MRRLPLLRLRTVFVAVNLLIFLLPLFGIALVRVYDNQLIRQTESELIAQGAFVAATYKEALLQQLRAAQIATPRPAGSDEKTAPMEYGGAIDSAYKITSDPNQPLHPVVAKLDILVDNIRKRAEEPRAPVMPPDPAASTAASTVAPALAATKSWTLVGVRVLDWRGTVVASTGGELGMSIAHREEVARALKGEFVSLLRVRISDHPAPAIDSPSRGTGVRVFVALPIVDEKNDRVLGAVVLSRTPMTLRKALFQDRYYLLATILVLVGAVLAVSLLAAAAVVRPVRALVRQTERLAQGMAGQATASPGHDASDDKDDPTVPLRYPVTHEIAQLSESFTRSARTLRERADYIRNFAASVSHEFKTPLASIRGTVELLRDHLATMTPEQRDRFLNNLGQDADRLDRLVRRLLDLARADVLKPSGETTHVGDGIEQVVARYRQGELAVEVLREGEAGSVPMARDAFESVVGNLMENARQHGGKDVHVTVSARRIGNRVILEVADDGPGISGGNAGKAFDPFFTTSRASGGTGLGLTIVRSIVTAHGGEVALAPTGDGQRGARFVVTLPAI